MNPREWGLFVSLSLAILTELGVKMFIALAERRRKLNQAWEEGRAEGIAKGRAKGIAEGIAEGRVEGILEGRAESRRETAAMLVVLNVAAQTSPDFLPHLLREYQAWYQNRATGQ